MMGVANLAVLHPPGKILVTRMIECRPTLLRKFT